MKLEEIYKRIKYKPKVEEVEDDSELFYGDVEKDWEWKPKRYEGDCEIPNFEIKIPNSRNGLYTTKDQLSKILTFIDTIKKKRLKNGITIIPIATTSKRNIYIWGGKQNVSNAIEYMKKIGLLVEYDSDYKYWGYKNGKKLNGKDYGVVEKLKLWQEQNYEDPFLINIYDVLKANVI